VTNTAPRLALSLRQAVRNKAMQTAERIENPTLFFAPCDAICRNLTGGVLEFLYLEVGSLPRGTREVMRVEGDTHRGLARFDVASQRHSEKRRIESWRASIMNSEAQP
jgi:hypothetical protein